MKQNKYDDEDFFEKYSQMNRSKGGLKAAGEWETLEKVLPEFDDARVLDLGCGYGWHCIYAAQHGAKSVLGIDISQKMLSKAAEITSLDTIKYQCVAIEDLELPKGSFDVVLSSLAFHYIMDFTQVVKKISYLLTSGGKLVFSCEHPIFTAQGKQDWYYDDNGDIMHFPVDNYFCEGERKANFLGSEVIKYHKTLTTYLNTLITEGFEITSVIEPAPSQEMVDTIDGMKDELRRPMMLIVTATKK